MKSDLQDMKAITKVIETIALEMAASRRSL